MDRKNLLMELLGIACLSAGLAILFHLLLPSVVNTQAIMLMIVLIVIGTAIAKGVPHLPATMKSKHFASAVKWPSRFSRNQRPTNVSPRTQGISMNELTRYFAWIEKKLQELVVREGLECGLVRMKRGPLVITLQLRLLNPTQKDLQKLMKLGPALAQLLQVETVRIAGNAQGILIEVPSPKPMTPNGALLTRHTRSLAVAIGVNAAARPILVNLEDHGALFWVGPSRRGKTQSMKSVLYALIRENFGVVQFIIIANPAKVHKDWGVFENLQGCLGIAASKENITAATEWLMKYMNGHTDFEQEKPIILIIDDLPTILKAVPQITPSLADIAGMGAGLGVHLLVGTQGAGSKSTSGGTEIENNVTARILYRPATSRSGSQSAGTGGLALHQLSSAKGDALALIDGNTTRIATAWISDRDIALLPSGSAGYPWRVQTQTEDTRLEQAKTTWNKVKLGLEQPKTTRNNGETGQNNPEQDKSTATLDSFQLRVPYRNGHVAEQRAEHVLEQQQGQSAEQLIEADSTDYLAYLAGLSIDELKQENLGLDATHSPTLDQQQQIRLSFGLCSSIRKTCFMAYGHYNGKVRDYVKLVIAESLEEPVVAQPDEDGIPDTIDLNTEAGRKLLKHLQGTGAINWADVRTLLEEAQ